jgi:hypothetical protein
MKTIAILQSNYLPWQGTFDLMAAVDEFVLLDTVQFTRNDWRNRNLIRTAQGPHWLTIPIRTAARFGQTIADAEVADPTWAARHFKSIAQNYGRTRSFGRYSADLEAAYAAAAREPRLARINRLFLDLLRGWLGIHTPMTSAADYPDHPDRIERLIAICQAAGAGRYISGPAARTYLDERRFADAGIELTYFTYPTYPEPHFSALDEVLHS